MCSMGGEEKSSYCYSDVASSSGGNLVVHHSFDPNPEIYNLTAGMEMIGFPSKTSPHHHLYQNEGELMIVSQDSSPTWTHPHHNHNRSLLVDDQSLRCVFPCDEENQRPTQYQTQALSLSLNSSNPSSIGLHTFDLRQQQQQESDDLRFGPSSSRSVNVPHLIQEHSFIRNSKYLSPAQELLNEFCNLGTKLQDDDSNKQKIHNYHKMSAGQDDETVDKKQSHLCSLDFLELQIRKTKLLQMLEEVDRRYKHYCDQMKAVVSSFEAVAGNGAALVYSSLASKAMSRHFRCLKDGIVMQIKATKKAMGEKDVGAAPATMRGETPRLRVIDQTMRQQRALQQMNMMESHPWRPQRGLPERSVSILRAWLFEHFLHPYPSDVDKHILARQTGLSRSQVSNWFINARVRLWKPMVEEMYLEEVKESEAGMGGRPENDDVDVDDDFQNPCRNLDQKPSQDQLVRIDSDCLSSIITNPDSTSRKDKSIVGIHNPNFARLGDSMELDFSSYNPHSGAVSLTLGLHQHGGPSLGFSPASVAVGQNNASSLFYPRTENMAECQTASYSLLESETQNLPAYRNLMGAQLLHDLAG